MIIDLTTKISKEFLEWIESFPKNKHVDSGHIGTHLDIYKKSDIPMEAFRTKAVVIDVEKIANQRDITIEDMKEIEIPLNGFVLFHTGRINEFEYGSDQYFANHPQLSHELIDYLLEKKIRFIGIDCSGIRRGEEHQAADELCELNGCYVIENLCNLDQLIDKNQKIKNIYTMWLEHPKATGLPCRVLAEII
ncbi:cyclase family protein [Clostridium minihomine]|uniref:cyclase family protein n=1 Tax=Clostridium minihomine TaxID=2045012 RepID=UPI000C7938FA|nr:cyclase family protein [Clostridium minihomine]